jgi:hypothetical protein
MQPLERAKAWMSDTRHLDLSHRFPVLSNYPRSCPSKLPKGRSFQAVTDTNILDRVVCNHLPDTCTYTSPETLWPSPFEYCICDYKTLRACIIKFVTAGAGGGELRHHRRGRAAEARQERADGRAREDAPEAELDGPGRERAAERPGGDEPAAAADDVVPGQGGPEPEHPAELGAPGAGAEERAGAAGRPAGSK